MVVRWQPCFQIPSQNSSHPQQMVCFFTPSPPPFFKFWCKTPKESEQFWTNIENRRKFLLDFATKVGFDPQELKNWSTKEPQLRAFGVWKCFLFIWRFAFLTTLKGAKLLGRYGNVGLQQLVQDTFPSIQKGVQLRSRWWAILPRNKAMKQKPSFPLSRLQAMEPLEHSPDNGLQVWTKNSFSLSS